MLKVFQDSGFPMTTKREFDVAHIKLRPTGS